MKKGLNIEVVAQAIEALRNDGVKPTNKAIIEKIGYGSFSTLAVLRQEYPDVFEWPDTQYSTVQEIVNKEFRLVKSVLDTQKNTLKRFEERLKKLEQSNEQAGKIQEFKREAEISKARIEQLEAENEQLRKKRDQALSQLEITEAKIGANAPGGAEGKALIKRLLELLSQSDLEGKKTILLPDGRRMSFGYAVQFFYGIGLCG